MMELDLNPTIKYSKKNNTLTLYNDGKAVFILDLIFSSFMLLEDGSSTIESETKCKVIGK